MNYLLLPTRIWTIKHLAGISWIKLARELAVPIISSTVMVFFILGAKALLSDLAGVPWLLALYIIVGIITYGLSTWLIAPNLFRKLFSIIETSLPIKQLPK